VRCGFSLVASESGMPESRDVADYVTTPLDNEVYSDDNEKDNMIWKRGLNKMYSAWLEGRDLIEWMRMQNNSTSSKTQQSMIGYCGLDIGGFYSDWDYPITKIQSYLKGEFPEFEQEWSRKLQPILDIMGNVKARYNYQHLLTPSQKSTLAVLLDELVMTMNSRQDELEGDIEYEWTKQSSISVSGCRNVVS